MFLALFVLELLVRAMLERMARILWLTINRRKDAFE